MNDMLLALGINEGRIDPIGSLDVSNVFPAKMDFNRWLSDALGLQPGLQYNL